MTNPSLITEAAQGILPAWAVAGADRRAHMARVAALLAEWAEGLDVSPPDQVRWQAAAYLHDALREEDPERLRPKLPLAQRALPGPILHGPAAAERLRIDGVLDGELLHAIAYHTLGSAGLGAMGRALYCADFLEVGRAFLPEWRAELRARMPGDLNAVTREIVGARLRHLVDRRMPILEPTVGFWNVLSEGG